MSQPERKIMEQPDWANLTAIASSLKALAAKSQEVRLPAELADELSRGITQVIEYVHWQQVALDRARTAYETMHAERDGCRAVLDRLDEIRASVLKATAN